MNLSLTGKKWKKADAFWREGAALAQATGLPPVVAHILAHRGQGEASHAAAFLSPRMDHLPDPSTLKDMQPAILRIAAAIQNHEKIAIFGDYDVDGTCATALLTRYFRSLGINPVLYIPDRLTEGYGPNAPAMRQLAGQGVQLVITVDTGIAAHEALEEAKSLGLDVVVTDHHPPHAATLPPAIALVNPNRPDDTSTLQTLCGTGVAFYVLMALNRHLRTICYFNVNKQEPRLNQWLDLVACGTVCDVMTLTGANRLLVAKGLQQLATWSHRGLAMLAQVAGVKDDVTASTFGFALGPRLNAAGRLESALAALNLLLADDDATALPLARQLNDLNLARRELEQAAVSEAMIMAEAELKHDPAILILANPQWHAGVVGLVASRVKERTGRPTFALGGGEGGLLKGSGRSVEGINLGAALESCRPLLKSGGGHAMAAGVGIDPANLPAFIEAMQAHVLQQVKNLPDYDPTLPLAHHLAPTLTLEAEVIPASLTAQLAQTFTQLAPFGNGNPEPLLALSKAHISYARTVGSTQEHLKLRLTGLDGSGVDAIAFGAMNSPLGPALMGKIPLNGPLTLAGHLRMNKFGGSEKVDFQVIDGKVG